MGKFVRRADGDALPAELTSFIGRRRELEDARRLLSSSRLVTLTGPGGVGKTRLALRVASQSARAFPDGVVLVELAEVRNPELVPHTIAMALGLRDEPTTWSDETLAERLAHRHLLLVLDNCEQLVSRCARLARHVLARAPEVHLLVTSREALKVAGEHTLAVPPLPVPVWQSTSKVPELAQYDGVQLFLERASARLPGFQLTTANAPHVAQICQRLDGIPLAIELAADRIRALPVEQINARLSSRLQLLTTGDRSAAARHQTLVASITWSYDLCTATEQRLWARLSVFQSTFDVAAVEAVCTDSTLRPEDVLDLLTELIEKSIVIREEAGAEARFRMLGSIREFGDERLQELGEAGAVHQRMLDWSVELTRAFRNQSFGPAQREWTLRLRAEHQNVAAALRFALDADLPEIAVSITIDLALYWMWAGLMSDEQHWLERALEAPTLSGRARAAALREFAYVSLFFGGVDTVPGLLAQALESYSDPDAHDRAHLRFVEGMYQLSHDPKLALEPFALALEGFREVGDLAGQAHTLLSGGVAAWLADEHTAAQALLEECLGVSGNYETSFRSSALMHLGMVLWEAGAGDQAREMVLEALNLKSRDEEFVGTAMCLDALSWFETAAGEFKRGATLVGIAETAWTRSGMSIESVRGLRRFRDECLDQLRSRLPAQVFADLIAAGAHLGQADALSFALNTTATPATSAPQDAFRPLTNREWQVAQGVAEGLGNRQIAGRLAISQRTADAHVAHILQKLAFNNRAQIAAWVTERSRIASL